MIQIEWWSRSSDDVRWWSRSSDDLYSVMIQIQWWSRSSDDDPWWSRSSDDDPDWVMIQIRRWRWLEYEYDLNMKMMRKNWWSSWYKEEDQCWKLCQKNTFLVKRECWCNCNFGMYSLVFPIYCNPMFISRCTWVMSCLDVLIGKFI